MSPIERVLGVLTVLLAQVLFLFGSGVFMLGFGMDGILATVLWDVVACAAIAVWMRHGRTDGPVPYGRLSSPKGLGSGLIILGAGSAMASISMSMLMLFLESRLRDPGMEMRAESVSAAGVGAYLFLSIAVAPLAEELFYRVFTYSMLRRYIGVWPAAILSSFLFGGGHFTLGHLVTGGLFGLLMAMAYEYTGKWWASVFCHFIYNFSVIAVSMTGGLVSAAETVPGGAASIVMSLALVGAGCAAVIRKERSHGLCGIRVVPDRDEADHP